MSITRKIRIMAGFVVLLSLMLGVEASPIFHSINWLWLTAFAGLNLFQSGITNFCLPEFFLKKIDKSCDNCS
ncbi:MAG: DUF2892 domain-containing protein [Gammaproteobacteria bacterium]|nr:DUF2892 domain-containing protein [Gammaproteobacteria bacterium]MDH5659391.1 DUF2892 domain-containing protein [Gammaproteobacteria bacterium]